MRSEDSGSDLDWKRKKLSKNSAPVLISLLFFPRESLEDVIGLKLSSSNCLILLLVFLFLVEIKASRKTWREYTTSSAHGLYIIGLLLKIC